MKTIIKVTKTHIKNGKSNTGYSCPIALAAKESLGLPNIYVGLTFISWDAPVDSNLLFRSIKLSDYVCEFIRDFDAGLEVEPFEFELELPDA